MLFLFVPSRDSPASDVPPGVSCSCFLYREGPKPPLPGRPEAEFFHSTPPSWSSRWSGGWRRCGHWGGRHRTSRLHGHRRRSLSPALRGAVKGSTPSIVEIMVMPVVPVPPTRSVGIRRDISWLVAIRNSVAGLNAVGRRGIGWPPVISGRTVNILLRVS